MEPYDYQTFRIIYEVTSAILYFILLRFMLKPYQLTRETRYLGLPLGFGFLGVTSALAAFFFYQPFLLGRGTMYVQLVLRTFAFIFLITTYYFSRKNTNNKSLWNATLVILIVACLTLFLLVIIPDIALPSYQAASMCTRIINLTLIAYICAHTLRSHIKAPDPETVWTPLGFLLLGISQYSLIVWALDESYSAFFGALAIRWAGLAIFLAVAIRSFYSLKKEGDK